MDLCREFRPKTLTDVVGQPEAVTMLKTWVEKKDVPQVVLFVGPTGTGKTTLARFLAGVVGADEVEEVNCASNRGIDMAREVEESLAYRPMTGGARVWLLEEAVQLPKTTQQAMLAWLEEPKPWAYFFLCASETGGLLPTFKRRCRVVQLNPVPPAGICGLLAKVLKALKQTVNAETITKIANAAGGSPGVALNLLEMALAGATEVTTPEASASVLDLYRAATTGGPWARVVAAREGCKEQAEGVRKIILALACHDFKRGNPAGARVARVMQYGFSDSGEAGLWLALWDVWAAGQKKSPSP